MAAATSTILSATMAGLSVAGAANQIGALGAQNEFSKRMTEINIRRAKAAQGDALERGQDKANKYRSGVQRLVGSQKAAIAGQGISISGESASGIITDTIDQGYEDARNIETNAFRESLGYGMQATDYASNQALDNAATGTKQLGTLLTGFTNAGLALYGK
jgi:hypothetical protein